MKGVFSSQFSWSNKIIIRSGIQDIIRRSGIQDNK